VYVFRRVYLCTTSHSSHPFPPPTHQSPIDANYFILNVRLQLRWHILSSPPPPLTYARRHSYATAPNVLVVIVNTPSMMRIALNACAVKRCSFVAFSHYPVSDPYFPSSIIHIFFTHYLTTYRFTGQGRHTDLICRRTSNHSSTLTSNPKDTSPSAIVTKSGRVFVGMMSNSDLYHHRNTSNASGGASCHACTQQRLSPSYSHTRDYISTGIPPWVCVSKSSSSSSCRTQCASIAHSQQDISNIAHHHRNRQARKRFMKQQRVLCEVVIPCNQYKLSIQEIEDDIIVFDGGNPTIPPILSPDGLTWRSIPISKLYVEDKTNPNVGLSCPRINNSPPFFGSQASVHCL
jgi:hypothetical protein